MVKRCLHCGRAVRPASEILQKRNIEYVKAKTLKETPSLQFSPNLLEYGKTRKQQIKMPTKVVIPEVSILASGLCEDCEKENNYIKTIEKDFGVVSIELDKPEPLPSAASIKKKLKELKDEN